MPYRRTLFWISPLSEYSPEIFAKTLLASVAHKEKQSEREREEQRQGWEEKQRQRDKDRETVLRKLIFLRVHTAYALVYTEFNSQRKFKPVRPSQAF